MCSSSIKIFPSLVSLWDIPWCSEIMQYISNNGSPGDVRPHPLEFMKNWWLICPRGINNHVILLNKLSPALILTHLEIVEELSLQHCVAFVCISMLSESLHMLCKTCKLVFSIYFIPPAYQYFFLCALLFYKQRCNENLT